MLLFERKFVVLFCTLFFALVLCSAVSATNTNTYVNVNGNNSWDGSNPTHTNATNGPKQTIASGLSVTNNGGNISIAAGTYKEYNLIIAKNLTISGASKTNTIINAMGKNLIFFIKPGTIVTIQNLNLTNGNATNADYNRMGGGINNQGTLTIENCIFYNNHAKDATDADGNSNADTAGNGGAIYNNVGATLTIKNSEFSNNYAGNGGDSSFAYTGSAGGNGGAIYNYGIIQNIQACTFRNNHAGKGGKSSGTIHGYSGGYGGAIYNVMTINSILNCTFSNNHAGNGGSTQPGSAANPGVGGYGGAILNYYTLTVTNSTFDNNYAGNGGDGSTAQNGARGGNGGAIYNAKTNIANSGIFTITNTKISNNYAGNGGDGAGFAIGGDAGNGGAIWNSGTVTITNCDIQNNTVGIGGIGNDADGDRLNGDNGMGGGIYNTATLTIRNSKIHDNTAESGGGIYTSGNTNIINTQFTNNTAQYRLKYQYSPVGTKWVVSDIYGGGGGAIWTSGVLTMMNNTFTNNTAMYGGAIYYTGNGNYSLNNCSFINNNVKAVDEKGNPLTTVTFSITGGWKTFVFANIQSISKSVLISKISPIQGITSILGDVGKAVKMVSQTEDNVEAAGGAIYMIKSVNLIINNCPIINNTASIGGGICNFGNGTLNITNTLFTGNAAGVGGAIYSNSFGALNATNNIFNGNCAHGGAAIGYTGTQSSQWGTLTAKYNIFRNNDASLGGAVYDNFQGNTKIHMNYNLIYGTECYDIYDEVGKADVSLNWWGINTGPSTYNVYGNITTSPWMVLTINSPDVEIGSNSTITFDMLHDSNGAYPNPAYGIVPDGIPISLIVSNGTITPNMLTLINGIANATYIANGNSGPVNINYTVDNNDHYLFSSTFIVNKIQTNTYLNPASNFAGQNVTLVAKVTDNKGRLINGGNVIFNIGIAQIDPVSVVNGYAEYYLHIPEGTQPLLYTITANYIGTNKYASSQATANLIIAQASIGSTGITVYRPINGTQGQTVNLEARLIDAYNNLPLANKNVAFSIGGNNVGSAITNSDGVANLFYRILTAPGSYIILASFASDFPYASSSNSGMLNVMSSPTGVSDLTITRKVQSIVRLGKNFVITFKVGNKGPDIAKDVVIKFTIPKGLDFITAIVDQGIWSYNKATGVFTWKLGDVSVGDPYLFLTLKANKLGKYQLKHLLTTKTFDPSLIRNQMVPLSIVITTPGDNNWNNGNGSSVNVEGKTIGMQKTGLPITGLIIAILALLGGLASSKRK